ncbi:AAA family ATPase [Chryseobacterium fluminis]|uniref:AAA family ATPase n=1 Tax=Chryseobacterium fluminis TaxID=2983606 RepID=UPI002259E286|nr:AAA family ATPase [Chryseobacterium sp. MMS21-Ot14]UZT98048.1 AAA family ATPase [Chryseobacterium sp. MMS21-Ot14]
MKPIDILGVKNFRIFDDKDGMFTEMAGINLITGANNTGKSSITKLLQMVRNSMNGHLFPFDLDLTEQEHLLGDFNNLLHNKENKHVNISLPFTFLGLTKLYVSLTFEVADDDSYKAKLRAIEVKDYSAKGYNTLFSFIYRTATQDEKKAYEEEFQREQQEYEDEKIIADRKREEVLAEGNEYSIFTMNPRLLIQPMRNPLDSFVEWTINTKMLKNYLDQLLKIYKLYKKHNRNIDWLEHSDKVAYEGAIHFIPSTFINSFKGAVNTQKWQEFIDEKLKEKTKTGKSAIGEYDFDIDDIFDARLGIEHILYKKSLDILKNQLSWNEYEPKSNEFTYNVIVNCFETSWKNLANRISSIHIISALREENSRGYSTNVNTPFTTLLRNFDSLKGEYNNFIKKYLVKFEIGKEIKVEHLLSYQLMKASIKTLDGEVRELVDFGSGIKQLILILMQISVLSKKNELRNHIYDYRGDGEMIKINYRPSILVIEEPENYLHPKWQSILAEMFLDASEKYNIQLIIETHSEYCTSSNQLRHFSLNP